ncbi:MAG: hypothetical protein JO041_06895 [Acidobacteria bacterium]|nr:hypothetical protein [Acidobacteriota bacterium]
MASPYKWPPGFIPALVLLAAYAGLCARLITQLPMQPDESCRAFAAPSAETCAGVEPSPLAAAIAHAVPWRRVSSINPKILLRLPFAAFGLLLGASLALISLRWYGTWGGLVAIVFYCFSPAAVLAGAAVRPDGLAAWGFYGAIFLAVATAHTLYAAPRSLGRWRSWRNPLLWGIALGVGTAAEPWVIFALPFAFAYVWYLVPGRRVEATLKLLAGCAIAGAIAAAWGFHLRAPASAFGAISLQASTLPGDAFRAEIPLLAAVGCSLLAWAVARRLRHFSNTAPLLIVPAVCLLGRPASAVPFAAMFAGGVMGDAVTRQRWWRLVAGLLMMAAVVNGLYTVANL